MAKETDTVVMVPVVKHVIVEISRLDGGRGERELTEELGAKFAQGYVVRGHERGRNGGVVIKLEKTEEWTLEEFMNDVRSKLS